MKRIKFYILQLGRLGADPTHLSPGSFGPTASNPSVTVNFDWIPCDAILVEHPAAGKILIDCGSHPKAMKGVWPEIFHEIAPYYDDGKTMEQQLALCGAKPENIKTVILSHMHCDHTGYLYLFPHANVYVHRTEFAAAMVSAFETLENHGLYLRTDLNIPVEKYTLIDGDTEVCEGIKMLHSPGHTMGVCAILVELESGTVIFTRDVCHTAMNYGPPAMCLAPGLMTDSAAYVNSIERIRKIAAETNATVIFGHDKAQYLTMKYAPEYYE